MSKITTADLLKQDRELQDLDNDLVSGKYGEMRAVDVLKLKRQQLQQKKLEEDPNSSLPYHKRESASSQRASFGDYNNKQNDLNYLESEINKENPGNENSLGNRSGQLDENGQSLDTKSSVQDNNFEFQNYFSKFSNQSSLLIIFEIVLFFVLIYVVFKKIKKSN